VDIREISAVSENISQSAAMLGGGFAWSYCMARQPRELAEHMSDRHEARDGLMRETFRLPVEAARLKAREILNQFPQAGYTTIVEQWRQLPDGRIEFTMRRLQAAD
jgi:hypothetical protein